MEAYDPDKDVSIDINLAGETAHITRENTTVFGFLGALSIYDHIFYVPEDQEETEDTTCTYIFKDVDGYDKFLAYLLDNYYEAHLNLVEVAECDVEAWENHTFKDVRGEASFPQKWEVE